MSIKDSFSEVSSRRSSSNRMRTAPQRYIAGGVFLFFYLFAAIFFLDRAEAPGKDDNILILAIGSVGAVVLGFLLAPHLSFLVRGAGHKTKRSTNRFRNNHSNK